MFKKHASWARGTALAVLGAFLSLVAPIGGFAAQEVVGAGNLIGYIYGDDGRTPVAGAVVKLRNVDTGAEMLGTPSDASGLYRLTGIPEGRYVLGVTSAAGDFNFEYQIFIKAGETGKLSLALIPRQPIMTEGLEPVYVEPEGTAVTPKKKGPLAFFTTPVGIASIVVIGSLGAYGIYHVVKKEEEVSPAKK